MHHTHSTPHASTSFFFTLRGRPFLAEGFAPASAPAVLVLVLVLVPFFTFEAAPLSFFVGAPRVRDLPVTVVAVVVAAPVPAVPAAALSLPCLPSTMELIHPASSLPALSVPTTLHWSLLIRNNGNEG